MSTGSSAGHRNRKTASNVGVAGVDEAHGSSISMKANGLTQPRICRSVIVAVDLTYTWPVLKAT